ncbi:MAG TPA: 2-oxoacid:acceptor oxidoreductase family protein [Armatimonadota bacterium]
MNQVVTPGKTNIHHELIVAGFGGQGVLKLGLTLAEAAMHEGSEVVWIPAYGPETRGGPSFCTVIIDAEPIGAPVIALADTAIIMDQPSLDKYQQRVRPGGRIIINSSLVDPARVRTDVDSYALDANRYADEIGDPRVGNMVMLGAFLHLLPLVALETVITSLSEALSKRNRHLLPLNQQALAAGAAHLETLRLVPSE